MKNKAMIVMVLMGKYPFAYEEKSLFKFNAMEFGSFSVYNLYIIVKSKNMWTVRQ